MTNPTLRTDLPLPYCKGCGHALVLKALGAALDELALPADQVAVVTDIGCVGLADDQFATPHTIHTTHGRSTAFAAGISLADAVLGPAGLKTVVLIGDGGAMIGLLHLVQAALYNPDVTVIVHNNFLFGMTGGQGSSFSPMDFVTATTPVGNFVPPLDLAQVLLASRAPFVARKVAGDRDLTRTLADAIAHPGFAMVEVLELCTAHATRHNPLTGAKLKDVAEQAGYGLGLLRDAPRPTFGTAYRAQAEKLAAKKRSPELPAGPVASLDRRVGLVLAGTAGERVQSAAGLLAEAALAAGLHVTQKNDNPVTQGTGFSVSEVVLSPEPILFTGIEAPDAVLVVSQDGAKELARSGVYGRVTAATRLFADESVTLPELPCAVERHPFRQTAGPKRAALAAVARLLGTEPLVPRETFLAASDLRHGKEASELRALLDPLLG
ncbi:MAG: 2-oxoacid:acceptor oxidoreductase family protein [Deltaproteobacteria bacterium]|nr:2-oxoacid:acceptor oxidoreductase family protein [Deltaproteobacteria bacterium]